MLFNGKDLIDIKESDLQGLISIGQYEIKTMEFKSKLIVASDGQKKEFLADVSSFANASGGHIVYGAVEHNGKVTDFPGLAEINPDQEILRLENLIREGIAPRIPGITSFPVGLSNGNYVLIIQIPNSWAAPHMVTFQGTSKFFCRNSAGKYQLDVHEIKRAFLFSEGVTDKIRNFISNRLGKIGVNETPVPILDRDGTEAKIVVHFIPIEAFQTANLININDDVVKSYAPGPLHSPGERRRFNLDGLVTYSILAEEKSDSYSLLFRNGIVEMVNSFMLSKTYNKEPSIPSHDFELTIVEATKQVLGFAQKAGIQPPIFVFLSLLGVKGYKIAVSRTITQNMGYYYNHSIDRDSLLLPEISLETYSTTDLPILLKPAFDAVWNSAGWPGSMNYDRNGNWRIAYSP